LSLEKEKHMRRVLLVEDEPEIARFLKRGLTYKGFEVVVASDGEQALNAVHTCAPDLVLLDVKLPDMDGYEVCRRLRQEGKEILPVLMLSSKDDLTDKIAGLESGADDYITKPFVFEELVARIRAALRRVEYTTHSSQELHVGDLVLDTAARQVWREGMLIELTAREFNLLELLIRHCGQVLTKAIIFERIWGYDNEAGLEIIKVYINALRAKLNAGGKPDLIHTVRGVGYVLKPQPKDLLRSLEKASPSLQPA
jgi:two-component system response regulator MprA